MARVTALMSGVRADILGWSTASLCLTICVIEDAVWTLSPVGPQKSYVSDQAVTHKQSSDVFGPAFAVCDHPHQSFIHRGCDAHRVVPGFDRLEAELGWEWRNLDPSQVATV